MTGYGFFFPAALHSSCKFLSEYLHIHIASVLNLVERRNKKKEEKHKNRGKREKVFTIKQKQKKDREKEIRDVIMYGAATAHHYAWGIYHVCIFHRILTKMTDL